MRVLTTIEVPRAASGQVGSGSGGAQRFTKVSTRQTGSRKDTAPSNEIDPISKKYAILRQIRGPETAITVSPKEERRHDADI